MRGPGCLSFMLLFMLLAVALAVVFLATIVVVGILAGIYFTIRWFTNPQPRPFEAYASSRSANFSEQIEYQLAMNSHAILRNALLVTLLPVISLSLILGSSGWMLPILIGLGVGLGLIMMLAQFNSPELFMVSPSSTNNSSEPLFTYPEDIFLLSAEDD